MASENGDQSPTKDPNDTSPISEADSGRGPSGGEDQPHLDEEEPRVGIEEESSHHGPQTAIVEESQNRQLQEDDIYTEGDGKPTATGNEQQSCDEGGTLATLPSKDATPGNEASIPQATEASSVPQEVRPLSYSQGQDVPEDVLEEVKKRGDGKSDAVKAFWSAVSNHLKEFEEVQDCNLLPLQNGVLMPRSEITTGNITRSTVKIEQVPLEKFGEEDASAFLQLNDCPQVCKPFGLVLDEDKVCVYFLMERLTGRTLKDILKDPNEQGPSEQDPNEQGPSEQDPNEQDPNEQDPNEQDPNEQDPNEQDPNEQDPNEQEERIPIDIPLAVIITIDLLKGVQYIHSKRLWHSDVAARNVIVFLEDNWIGPRAVLIDTTGARQPTRNIDHAWDNAKIFRLLNDMLNNVFYCKEPWKASAEDKGRYNERSLGRLEKLIKVQSDGSSPEAFTVEKVLQWLQEISEVLEVKAEIEDLKKDIEARDRELADTKEKLKDQEKQISELQSKKESFVKSEREHTEDFKRVNKKRMELKSKVRKLQDEIRKRQDREKELVIQLELEKQEKQGPSEQGEAIKEEDSEEIVLPNPDEQSSQLSYTS
ncbi:Hypp992 [Branchiostoma lanceolatum]|uniref:Hypp992 protein n=1 Tax=Branchiostoma lanceolatum TaxID=7740 RepID=A0A8J9ZDQ8_BRALA|nr:Hypp992 [Branchiostoma lanceolatum]